MDFTDHPISFDTKPRGFGKRHILAFMGFLGFALSYSMRFNLSIAIVAMVNSSNHQSSQNTAEVMFHNDICDRNLKISNSTPPDETYLFIPLNHDHVELELNKNQSYQTSNDFANLDPEFSGEFNWSESQQGIILGSFFWGYLLTQIPGGWLGHHCGGKWPFGLGLLVTALLTIATPIAARWGGFCTIVVIRVMQGLAGGVTVPCMHALLARWIPPAERGAITAFVYAGTPFGSAVSLITSGYIIPDFGWPYVFYFTGAATILWYLLWASLIYSGPTEHPTITPIELKFIQNSVQGSSVHSSKSPPWRKVLKSPPFWAIVIGQFTETYGLYTIMTELPTYMKTVLHYDIKQNSLISAFPHFLTWVVGVSLTQLGDFFIERKYFSISVVRKSCNTVGMWGAAAALLGVAYSGCDRFYTVSLLSIGIASTGGIYGGVLVNLIDIAPNYAGILMGVSNTAAAIPGFLAPWIAGIIINNDPSLSRWKLVFIITSAVYFIGNLLFIWLASGEEQSWNNEEGINDKTESGIEKGNKTQTDLTTFFSAPVQDELKIEKETTFPPTIEVQDRVGTDENNVLHPISCVKPNAALIYLLDYKKSSN